MKALSSIRRAFAAVSGWLTCEKELAKTNADIYPRAYAAIDTVDPTEKADAIGKVWAEGFTAYNKIGGQSIRRIFGVFALPAMIGINIGMAEGPLTPAKAAGTAFGLAAIACSMAAANASMRRRAEHTDALVPTFKSEILDIMVNDPVAFNASEMGQRFAKMTPEARQNMKTHFGQAFVRPFRNLANPANRIY